MTELTLENLDALIAKGQELKKLLTDTPEILEYLRLAEKFSGEKSILPMPADRLIRMTEAAKILKVSNTTICRLAREKILTAYYTPGSSNKKFWLSQVKAVAQKGVE